MDWLLENSKDEKLKQTIILLSGKEVLTKEEQDESIIVDISKSMQISFFISPPPFWN